MKAFTITVPTELDSEDRKIIGEEVVNFILQRTDSGIDKNGSQFAGYSQSYINSRDFKEAGKSPSQVNLRLTDEMMDSLDIIADGPGWIQIGYNGGAAEEKATWAEDTLNGPTRKFLGIQQADLDSIVNNYMNSNVKLAIKTQNNLIDKMISNALKQWFS